MQRITRYSKSSNQSFSKPKYYGFKQYGSEYQQYSGNHFITPKSSGDETILYQSDEEWVPGPVIAAKNVLYKIKHMSSTTIELPAMINLLINTIVKSDCSTLLVSDSYQLQFGLSFEEMESLINTYMKGAVSFTNGVIIFDSDKFDDLIIIKDIMNRQKHVSPISRKLWWYFEDYSLDPFMIEFILGEQEASRNLEIWAWNGDSYIRDIILIMCPNLNNEEYFNLNTKIGSNEHLAKLYRFLNYQRTSHNDKKLGTIIEALIGWIMKRFKGNTPIHITRKIWLLLNMVSDGNTLRISKINADMIQNEINTLAKADSKVKL